MEDLFDDDIEEDEDYIEEEWEDEEEEEDEDWDDDEEEEDDEEPSDDHTARYPHVHVQLTGEDGNPMSIIARVSRELRHAGVEPGMVALFREQALSGDYDHVLATCMQWVSVG